MNNTATKTTKTVPVECPACSCKKAAVVRGRVYQCVACEAIHGDCYLGDSYLYVLPYLAGDVTKPENQRYFDLTCLGSRGVTRRHGWFDLESRKITQIG